MTPKIPDKVYFKIGEVARIVEVETHVLRFWETEFPQARPERTQSKQRRYKRRHIELFLEIKRLLYEEQYTIPGAKKKLLLFIKARAKKQTDLHPVPDDFWREVRNSLVEIQDLLKKK